MNPTTTLPDANPATACGPTGLPAWDALCVHRDSLRSFDARQALAQDHGRAAALSRNVVLQIPRHDPVALRLDVSKHRLTTQTLGLLCALAEQAELPARLRALFGGERVNHTEQRAAMHMALRAPAGVSFEVDGRDVMADVLAVRRAMLGFAEEVRSGAYRLSSGLPATDVVNIGIGGSDLGPAMATQALAPFADGPRLHFVSNIDPGHLLRVIKDLDPQTTLFILASKTFTTQETMTNARLARDWLAQRIPGPQMGQHFCAVTTALDKAAGFGIPAQRCFGFWDWVGGRYSMWSSVGLPLAIAIGANRFEAMLAGAHAMDQHVATAPLLDNLPVLMGLIGCWYINFLAAPTLAVVPYNQDMARFAAHLQQLDMESNGKRVRRNGQLCDTATGPVVWGEPGSNSQHAYFQLLHQGTELIPIDFVLFRRSAWRDHPALDQAAIDASHRALLANGIAQAEALLRGKTAEQAKHEMLAAGMPAAQADALAPHRSFPGNRPSTVLLAEQLTPATLGALVALYEHKVFVQAAIWDINPFDQWGVELGKQLAAAADAELAGTQAAGVHDASTSALLALCRS